MESMTASKDANGWRGPVATVVVALACVLLTFIGGEEMPLGLLIAGIPLALALAWLLPVELALLFIVMTMFRLHEAYPVLMPLRLPLLVGLLAMLSCALHMLAGRLSFPRRPELVLALLFFLHVTIGSAFGVNIGKSYEMWPDVIVKLLIAMLFLSVIIDVPRDAGKVAFALVGGSSLIAIVAIYNQMNGLELVEGTRVTIGRSTGSQLADPNDLAFALMFPVAFALSALTIRGQRWGRRLLWLAALVLICWAILATKSRGGMLATIAVAACVFAINYKAKVGPMIAVAVLGAVLYSVSGIGTRETAMGSDGGLDASAMTRLDTWRAAVLMALSRPIFGVGIGNFSDMYWSYADFWHGKSYVTHSIWFQALSETGFVGLGLLVAMFVTAIRSAYKSMRLLEQVGAPSNVLAIAVSIFAGWIGVAVAGSFLSQIFGWQVFTLVALTAALSHHVARMHPREALAAGLERQPAPSSAQTVPAPRLRPVP